MKVLFTSDLHLGHKSIHKYRTYFSNADHHDTYVLLQLSKLDKRTILYVLGDFLFDGPHLEEYLSIISKMPCTIKVIPGNHDSKSLYTQTIAKNIITELPLFTYKGVWLSHCPIHPQEMRNRIGNIHGHLHNESIPDKKYFNVNLDVNDFKFVPLENILTTLRAANESNA